MYRIGSSADVHTALLLPPGAWLHLSQGHYGWLVVWQLFLNSAMSCIGPALQCNVLLFASQPETHLHKEQYRWLVLSYCCLELLCAECLPRCGLQLNHITCQWVNIGAVAALQKQIQAGWHH